MNLTEVTAPTPLCFSYIAELKIGNMILAWDFRRLSAFPWWQRSDLAPPSQCPDTAWKKLHQEQEMIGSVSTKSFEEISLGRTGVVSVRLGAAGDRMQSVSYSGSRHAPFFFPFFLYIRQSQAIFFFLSESWIWYPRDYSGFKVNDYTLTTLIITLTILPFFLFPHNTPNISWDISFLLVSL